MGSTFSRIMDDLNRVINEHPQCMMTLDEIRPLHACIDELQINRNLVLKSYETRGYCCTFRHLRDCFVEHVGDKCGDSTAIDIMVNTYVCIARNVSRLPTDHCVDYSGFRGTTMCQPDWLLIAEAIGLAIIFLVIVFGVILWCWRSSDGYRGCPQR